jgi:signal transduction histidine kinase
MEGGELHPKLASIDLQQIISAKEKAFVMLAQQKRVVVENAVGANVGPALADRHLTERILDNLLMNALKHTPSGGSIVIGAEAIEDPPSLEVSVWDSGPSVSPEDRETIFAKYYTTGSERRTGVRSFGIGLAFCRLAAEAQGGRIWVDSEQEHGAIFRFTLLRPGGAPGTG